MCIAPVGSLFRGPWGLLLWGHFDKVVMPGSVAINWSAMVQIGLPLGC